jgi:hypothetical protein
LMISVRRGTPRVTFLADTPAKWNVFRVICRSTSGMTTRVGLTYVSVSSQNVERCKT